MKDEKTFLDEELKVYKKYMEAKYGKEFVEKLDEISELVNKEMETIIEREFNDFADISDVFKNSQVLTPIKRENQIKKSWDDYFLEIERNNRNNFKDISELLKNL